MSIRRRDLIVGLFGTALSFIAGGAFAADTPLIKCTRVGQSVIYRNQKFTCVKKAGKLVWGKGVPLPVKSAAPSASPSASPTASATPTPTASATPKPTPTPAPMPSAQGIKVASSSDVALGGSKVVTATTATGVRVAIALARDSKGIHAFSAECPHAGYIVKPQGSDEFICPAHNSLFSSKDGAVLRGPASYGLGIYPVTETGGDIYVTI
ncbi:QcrA Rieske Fe-S protein [Candidatus Nanopelagicaceae bacterium]